MSTTQNEVPKPEENTEEILIKEFSALFTRENLETNNYFIYRMNMNLEIPFQTIFNERGIKNITQDTNLILNALKKTPNLVVNEKSENIIPKINSLKNKIIININPEEEESFRKFLLDEKWENWDLDFVFDRKNCSRIIFSDEKHAEDFLKFVTGKKFNNKNLEAYIEPENIYLTFLQAAHENKKYGDFQKTQGGQQRQNFDPNVYYQNMPPYNMYQPQAMPMMPQTPYYYPPYYPQQQYGGAGGYSPYYNPYISTMYIRKAKVDDNEYNEEGEEKYDYYSGKQYGGSYEKNWNDRGQGQENEQEGKYYQGKYYNSYRGRGKRGGRYPSRGYKRYSDGTKNVGNRVRINSDNFPPLNEQNKNDENLRLVEIKIKYKKSEIIKVFHDLLAKNDVKINEGLAKLKDEEIPFIKRAGASLRKISTN